MPQPPYFEPLAAADATFLYWEKPEAPLHIGGVYIFEGRSQVPGRRGALGIAQTIEERLHLVPRYRQKVQWLPLNLGHPVWVDDADFDLSFHVRRAALPSPGDEAALRDYAARVMSRPLDLGKPLWEMTVVEGLEGGRVALIHKVHHAMVDGISTIDIATLMLDADPEGYLPEAGGSWRPRPAPDDLELLVDAVWQRSPLQHARLLGQARLGGLLDLARPLGTGMLALGQSLLRPRPGLFFNQQIGLHRRIHHLALPLDLFKEVKNALGGTVNDVVLAMVAGGLRRWLRARREPVPESVRILCPVSVRDQSQRYRLGNRVSGMMVELPLGDLAPAGRLERVQETTGDLKRSRQAVAAQTLVQLADWSPATLQALAGRLLPADQQWLVNFIVTNVPGPQIPFYSGGAQLLEVWPFVPIYPSVGLGVALVSYIGKVHFGLVADRDLVPDLEAFGRHLERAARELQRAARAARGSARAPAAGRRAAGRRRD